MRKQFNKARKTSIGDWERFKESQRIYTKVTVVAKRNNWKILCESTVSAPEASNFIKFSAKKPTPT